MQRAAKNELGTIICSGNDEGQSGNYPVGSSDETRLGVWCDWTFEQMPEFVRHEDHPYALYFKENEDQDGMELRTMEEIELSPNE